MSDSITQAVDSTLSKNGVAADAAAVGGALATKAPAGYGLGNVGMKVVRTPAELDACLANGWVLYQGWSSSGDVPFADGIAYALIRIDSYSSAVGTDAGAATVQTAYPINNKGCTLRRVRDYGVWSAWEWDPPPMALGVEYRTTERWDNKVVYTKLVNFGTLPATNTSTGESAKNKDVDIGISYANVIDLQAVVTAPSIQLIAGNILIGDGSKLEYKFTMIGTKIRCTVTGDYTGFSAVVRVKYTKD